jgi:UDP-glucose 4-epimerase
MYTTIGGYKLNKILVMGGAGFIGLHLTEELILHGLAVTVLDEPTGGFVDDLVDGVRFIQGSVCNVTPVNDLFEKESLSIPFTWRLIRLKG